MMFHRFHSFQLAALFLVVGFAFSLVEGAEIQTVAGSGKAGFAGDGGLAKEAHLNQPFGVVVAPDGDIIFCDTENHVIRRISRKGGKIETIVGTGERGYSGDGGAPELALLNEPYEVRFHPSGDLYWVERISHTVRKLDARSNVISTVVGTGEAGFSGDGGPATSARLNQPHSIQFDEAGENLFICDIKNHRIRKFDLDSNVITTWCGTGKASATEDGASVSPKTPLKGPRALDRDPSGDLWLALREGNQVYRIDMKSETLHWVAGTGKKGFHEEVRPAKKSELSGPKGVAISPDGTQIYLADTESHTVRVIDLNENPPVLELVVGTGKKGDGPDSPDPLECEMARLHGIGIDPISGDLYIGDSETHKVRKVSQLPGESPYARGSLAQYSTKTFTWEGRQCRLTAPKNPLPGKPWIWRCRFYGAFPSVDEALLAKGWYIAWIDVGNLFGGPEAMEIFDGFYDEVRSQYGLAERPIMEGFSRGGLPALNWALRRPEKVLGVYLDAPVLSIHSWPRPSGGKLWETCLNAYGLTQETAGEWKGPLEQLKPVIENKTPLFLVAGGADAVVPFQENGGILEQKIKENGGSIEVIVKSAAGHHPHSLHNPSPVVDWAEELHGE